MREKGFSFVQFFVELMVVFAIICFMSSLLYVVYNNATIKARDAQRIMHLEQIRVALELYRNDNQKYPDYASGSPSCGGWAGFYADYTKCWEDLEYKLRNYIILPRDPEAGINGRPDRVYWYKYRSATQDYVLLMKPQNSAVLSKDDNCYADTDPNYYCIGNR